MAHNFGAFSHDSIDPLPWASGGSGCSSSWWEPAILHKFPWARLPKIRRKGKASSRAQFHGLKGLPSKCPSHLDSISYRPNLKHLGLGEKTRYNSFPLFLLWFSLKTGEEKNPSSFTCSLPAPSPPVKLDQYSLCL